MLKPMKKTFRYGQHDVTLEVGTMARQADAGVLVTMGDTVVLVTCVAQKTAKADAGFFPLTVNYQEKTYAVGRVPGGYFKREGRPTEKETLTSRLIDRPIRPLFPNGFYNEVQVIATVLSLDTEIAADIAAMIGASAAVTLSGVPFKGPIAAARVGYRNNEFILNPGYQALQDSDLDLVVAGTEKAVLMVESEANVLPEDTMLDAVLFGHQHMQCAIQAINEMKSELGVTEWAWQPAPEDPQLTAQLKSTVEQPLLQAYQIADKMQRYEAVAKLREQTVTELARDENDADSNKPTADQVSDAFAKLEKTLVRSQILAGNPRIDGRDTRTVRPISIRTRLLPRAHGSALFTRGETQALAAVTLGSERDAQIVDALEGEVRDRFMLHYNFPPYCVGETGMMSGPKRREIGHGKLAKRALGAVLPKPEAFPYVIRVVSEITESNGSSSMATVCGSSLSLMDAGVPIKAPVAGIAMGLIKEEQRFAVLSDILGDEDHLGDMDFKVAGTEAGITALQMDIKIDGINRQIMHSALQQAKEGRLHILGEMAKSISAASGDISPFAPRILTMQIDTKKIGDVIGKGGATIRQLCEETGATIDINDDGTISIFATDAQAGTMAQERIEALTADVEAGQVYTGKVEGIKEFGAFVELIPGTGKKGLLHISQICEERVENVNDKLAVGDDVTVKVLEVDRQGRIRLSAKPSVVNA